MTFLHDAEDVRVAAEMAGFVLAALLAFVAYRTGSRALGLAAAFLGGTWFAGVFLCGFIFFPLLLVGWRANPRMGYGWLLLATMVSSTAALYWRIPWPPPFPASPTREAAGVVSHIETVSTIWRSDEGGLPTR